jgi:hypothetical protein
MEFVRYFCKLIHPSFCVLNSMLPACRSNFAEVARIKQKAELARSSLWTLEFEQQWQRQGDSISQGVKNKLICYATSHDVGRDSSVDIATRYGLDGPGMK